MTRNSNKQLAKLAISSLLIFLPSVACQFLSNLISNSFQPTSVSPSIESTSAQQSMSSARDDMILLFIPEGEFIMGDNNGELNEQPEHVVYLDAFWIDQTEVTNEMYLKCVSVGICNEPLSDGFTAPDNVYNQPENAKLPVVYVSWNDAATYCAWAGRRLPTEAEWEKAARGTSGQKYPWGDETPNSDLLNFNNHFNGLTPVGSFPAGASPYGVFDMAGNVWEYVQDLYDEEYYAYSPKENPRGPAEGEYLVVRGSGFFNQAHEVRVSFRNYTYATYNRSGDFGFRCAADHIPQP